MNETLILTGTDKWLSFLNSTGGIPLVVKTTTETSPYQFWTSIFIAAIGSIFILWFLLKIFQVGIYSILIKIRLFSLKNKTKKHTLIIKHTQANLFSQSMINEKTFKDVVEALRKFKGEPFDLVIHSPGGQIFHTILLARLIKNYHGEVRTIVPYYAMSGGTILSLAADKIGMSENACLGPVDPQLGNLFKFGSADSWGKIVKLKGKKAEDSSISFAYMGKQYTKTIKNLVMELLKDKIPLENARRLTNFLTSGKVEHAYQITPTLLKSYGFNIEILDEKTLRLFNEIINSEHFEGVIYS